MESKSKILLELCRVCLKHSSETRPLFDPETDNLAEKITLCTGVEFLKEEGSSSVICESCYADLETAYRFKITCQIAQDSYKKLRQAMVKLEPFQIFQVTEDGEVKILDDHHDDVDVNYDAEYDDDNKDKIEFLDSINVKKEDEKVLDVPCNLEKVKTTMVQTQKKAIRKNQQVVTKKGKVKLKPKIEELRPKKETKIKLVCTPCGIDFESKEELLKHKKEFHRRRFICDKCGKVSQSHSSHYTHTLSHNLPRFACSVCDYRANYKSDLAKHFRIHTDEIYYQCEHCEKTFNDISNMRVHYRSRHTKDRPRNHACHLCEKRFFARYLLTRHLHSHSNEPRYSCEVCDKKFVQRKHWRRHLLNLHGVTVPLIRPGRQRYIQKISTDENTKSSFELFVKQSENNKK